MGSSNQTSFLLLFFVTTLTLAQFADARGSRQDFLNSHNAVRASVGVGPVSWNSTVAAYALKYARQAECELVHSNGPYGENLFWGYGTTTEAVNYWADERQYYDYDSNSCAAGQVCGHYTQVVWAKSTSIGCARVACRRSLGAFYIICNYSPPGNYIGERPY